MKVTRGRRIACLGAAFLAVAPLGATRSEELTERPVDGRVAAAVQGAESTHDLEQLRARWERLSPEEQGRMRERYESFKALDDETRDSMTRQARRIDSMARRLHRSLPPDQRERLDRLEPAKRREMMRELVAVEMRSVGRRILEKLPTDLRTRLENAEPEDQVRFLEEFRRTQHQRLGPALQRLAQELRLPAEAIDRLLRLPEEERESKLLDLVKRRTSMTVSMFGLPEGVLEATWERLQALPPPEFFESLMRLRESHPGFGRPAGRGRPRFGHDLGRERPFDETRRRHHEQLRRAHYLDPREHLDLHDLSPEERREELNRRRRQRLLEVIRTEKLLPPDKIDELEKLPNHRFFPTVREIQLGGGFAEGERGDGGE